MKTIRRASVFALLSLLSLSSACIPKVQAFQRFDLQAGHADVLWLFVNERLHRCVSSPRGPVCARVNYIETPANSVDLAAMPATPPAMASTPPTPHG